MVNFYPLGQYYLSSPYSNPLYSNFVKQAFSPEFFRFNGEQNHNYTPNWQNNTENSQTNPENENSDFEFAKTLPQNPNATETVIQVGHDGQKIKGYYATNPQTGETIYVDENGNRFTEQAFRNWEQFAKDGTFVYL